MSSISQSDELIQANDAMDLFLAKSMVDLCFMIIAEKPEKQGLN